MNRQLCVCGNIGIYNCIGIYSCHTCYWERIFNKSLYDDSRYTILDKYALDNTIPQDIAERIDKELNLYAPYTYIAKAAPSEVIRRCGECWRFIKNAQCFFFGYKPTCYRCCFPDKVSDDEKDIDNDRCPYCTYNYLECICSDEQRTPPIIIDETDFKQAYEEQMGKDDNDLKDDMSENVAESDTE